MNITHMDFGLKLKRVSAVATAIMLLMTGASVSTEQTSVQAKKKNTANYDLILEKGETPTINTGYDRDTGERKKSEHLIKSVKSSNKKILSVSVSWSHDYDDKGKKIKYAYTVKLNAKKAGDATITLKKRNNKTAKLKVHIYKKKEISMTVDSIEDRGPSDYEGDVGLNVYWIWFKIKNNKDIMLDKVYLAFKNKLVCDGSEKSLGRFVFEMNVFLPHTTTYCKKELRLKHKPTKKELEDLGYNYGYQRDLYSKCMNVSKKIKTTITDTEIKLESKYDKTLGYVFYLVDDKGKMLTKKWNYIEQGQTVTISRTEYPGKLLELRAADIDRKKIEALTKKRFFYISGGDYDYDHNSEYTYEA